MGQVKEVEVLGGHSLPQFVPTATAEAVGPWLADFWRQWSEQEEQRKGSEMPAVDQISDAFWARVAEAGLSEKRAGKL